MTDDEMLTAAADVGEKMAVMLVDEADSWMKAGGSEGTVNAAMACAIEVLVQAMLYTTCCTYADPIKLMHQVNDRLHRHTREAIDGRMTCMLVNAEGPFVQ